MFKKVLFVLILLLVSVILYVIKVIGPVSTQAHNELPAGFFKSIVVDNLDYPTGAAQAPDGRIFILEKGGTIRIHKNGALLPTPFATLPVATEGERGLLGIAFDSNFTSNKFVYVIYVNASPLEFRLSRFVAMEDVKGEEKVLFKTTQPVNQNHLGGTVRVGPDGKLWFSIGNNAVNNNSQDLSNPFGKILRINTDGTIPTDNPFYNHNSENASIWAYGFRNPFRFSFLGGKPIVGDVGEATNEEVNVVVKGGNYGWPKCEGECDGYVNPIFSYPHNGGSASITGGVMIPTGSNFPDTYEKIYMYGDYSLGFLRYLKFDSNGNFASDNEFSDHAGPVVDIFNGNDGNLYYITLADNTFSPGTGKLMRIGYDSENSIPVAEATATPMAGLAPLNVSFSAAGSYDPGGANISYLWDFGDGEISNLENPTHTYTQNGVYNAKLTVNNGKNSTSKTIEITVGKKLPEAVILTPVAGAKYNAGNTISFSGTASDAIDGELPESAFTWSILFHHETHIHPFETEITGVKTGSFTIPQTGEPSAETSYEIVLTVKNSSGLTTTVKRLIHPNVSKITLNTKPVDGLTVNLNGIPHETSYTFDSVVGFRHTLDTSSNQTKGEFNYTFANWSNGSPQSHTITTQATDTSYTANFKEVGKGNGRIYFRVRELDDNGQMTNKFINGATAKLTDKTGAIEYQTTISKSSNGEDGWVFFDNVPTGEYGVLSYKAGLQGAWRQSSCEGAGTTTNATIKTVNTDNFIASWQPSVNVESAETTWCHDLGLKNVSRGAVALRVNLMTVDPNNPENYFIATYINGATVKLTDVTGENVIATTTTASVNGQDGWAYIGNIQAGTYGLIAYKPGYDGFWKMTNCQGAFNATSSIKNEATNQNIAAFNNNVNVTAGITNYCYDLGLQGAGHIRYRVREFDADNFWTGKYINGATAKLTDPTGATVVATSSSKNLNGQDGWVEFTNIKAGNYGIMTYATDSIGVWKQTDCAAGGTTTNATIQNANSQNLIAAWQKDVVVVSNKITWCQDVGVRSSSDFGRLYFRIREINSSGSESGKFVNGATAKLVDESGLNVIKVATSSAINGQDGWVFFDNVPVGKVGSLVFKSGMKGGWKQTNCGTGGTTVDASINNTATENHEASYEKEILIEKNKISWCHDLGLTFESTTSEIRSLIISDSDTPNTTPSATLTPTPTTTPTPTSEPASETPTPVPTIITPTPSQKPEDTTPSPTPTVEPAKE